MEKIGGALAMFPQLAPGIIIGTLTGIGIGIYKDVKTQDFGNWWQLGGIGLALGAFAWAVLLDQL